MNPAYKEAEVNLASSINVKNDTQVLYSYKPATQKGKGFQVGEKTKHPHLWYIPALLF